MSGIYYRHINCSDLNSLSFYDKMLTSIALYGDSYVKRLREFCNNDLRVPGTVYWYDKGGLRADLKKRYGQREDTDARAMYNSMLELRPNVPFINVSGNDITSQTTPREIFDRMVLIVNDLQAAGTSTIFVAEIMTRGIFQRVPTNTLIRRRSTESIRKSTVFWRNDLKRILYVFLMSVIQKNTITTRSIS